MYAIRYTYAHCRTRESAQALLDELYADGEISEAEDPRIEPNRDAHRARYPWIITLAE